MTRTTARRVATREPESPPICDFCGSGDLGPDPVVFACDRVERVLPDVGIVLFEAGLWGACTGCVPLVRTRAWRAVIDRQIAVRRQHGDPAADSPLLRPELGGLLLAVERQLTGDEEPWRMLGAAA